MNKRVSMEDIYPLMRESLERGSDVSITVTGTSMLPLLHGGTDTALLARPTGRLKKYDLPLYRRRDGSFVLHRVVKVVQNGYIMCGDNQVVTEHGIRDEDIIAVVTSFTRLGKRRSVTDIPYRVYSVLWTNLRPLRRGCRSLKRRVGDLLDRKK